MKVILIGSLLVALAATETEVGKVRTKSFVPGPRIMSAGKTTPAFAAAAPVSMLTETGEAGHGGIGPVNAAVMIAPGLTLETKPGVQTVVMDRAGEVISGVIKRTNDAA